jgi:hypothetical protein
MPIPVREPLDLVFYRRTIPGSGALNNSCIKWGIMKVIEDNFVGAIIGISKKTRYLWERMLFFGKREIRRRIVSRLDSHP